MPRAENIWIIGASEGIGAALAREWALRGARLVLSARSSSRLDELAAELGPEHVACPLDVTDRESIDTAAAKIARIASLDRVVNLAALYDPGKIADLDSDTAAQIVSANLMGTFHIAQVAPHLLRDGGQLALCGSVAGYLGLPLGQIYSATKAGVINLAESLRGELAGKVDVRLICPGFVDTRLTQRNEFQMPAIVTPEFAARAIIDGLNSKTFEVHFPRRLTWGLKLLSALPYWAALPLVRKGDAMSDLSTEPAMQSRYLAIVVLFAALAFALSPFVTIGFNGFTPGQFPIPQENPPVQPSGYAFSIWGVIYLWLIIGAGFGVWRAANDPDWYAMRLPMAISLIIGTFWIAAANASPVLATAMIVVMAAAAIMSMLRAGHRQPWLQVRPVALYAGWLTGASGVAIGVLLGGYAILSAQTAAIICIALVLAVTLVVQSARPQEWGYPAAVVWALIGVIVANFSDSNWPVITLAAFGIASLTLRAFQFVRRDMKQ